MIPKSNYTITLTWDDEACVWIATSDDIAGLVLEHGSFDALVERVRFAVPDLLAVYGIIQNDISLDFIASRQEKLMIHG